MIYRPPGSLQTCVETTLSKGDVSEVIEKQGELRIRKAGMYGRLGRTNVVIQSNDGRTGNLNLGTHIWSNAYFTYKPILRLLLRSRSKTIVAKSLAGERGIAKQLCCSK
jgi:hypothetical protein